MYIGIFGRHPIPQPGFMGVMSLFEALYFSREGHVVDLIIPFRDQVEFEKFLRINKIDTLSQLDRYGAPFEIVPIFPGHKQEELYDAIIYQSYDNADYQAYFSALRASTLVLSKNFPKFVPSAALAFHETVESQFKSFDVVACALRDDVTELRMNRDFWQKYGGQVAYVPRGADPTMLHPGRKLGGRPTIGLEIPMTAAGRGAIDFYVEPIRTLQHQLPNLRVLTIGESPHPEIASEHIYFGRFDSIYENFFNEIWLYLIMDYGRSPNHVSAPIQSLHPRGWSARAIYEVQNIEAQMAGAAIVCHPRNIIPELIEPGSTALYISDYEDPASIAAVIRAGLENFPLLSRAARTWARSNHSWEHCISLWSRALLHAYESKLLRGL